MEKLSFTQQLIIAIVDTGFIGIILLFVGYLLNRVLARQNNNQLKLIEIEKKNMELRNNLIQDNRDRILSKIESQLAEFYYPIFYRLQKDDALWRLSPKLSRKGESLPMEANEIIEKEYIIKNHLEIVDILESKSHLIEMKPKFQEQIQEYLKHVAIYNTIRKVPSLKDLNPIDFDSHYPKGFQQMIEANTKILQKKHDDLLHKINADEI